MPRAAPRAYTERVPAAALEVSLPMYDLPETRAALDAMWAGIRARLPGLDLPHRPRRFDREPMAALRAHWASGALFLSQCCAVEAGALLADRLEVLGTAVHAVPGLPEGRYASHLVVRARDPAQSVRDLEGRRIAVNSLSSWSGAMSLGGLLADDAPLPEIVITGAHAESLAAVREGRADFAAVDAVTFSQLTRHRPAAVEGVRRMTTTESVPAPPFVTRRGARWASALRAALFEAFEDPQLADARRALGWQGILPTTSENYAELAVWPGRAPAALRLDAG